MIPDKNILREQIKKQRKALSHEQITGMSEKITAHVTASAAYKNSRCICVYIAAFNEPRTIPLIKAALADGKRICIPVSDTDTFTLTLSYIEKTDELISGAYGIPEPETIDIADPADVDLILVPGIVFDENGSRIGFGKGFYDRLLAGTASTKIGICYSFQICGGISADTHDIPMDMLATEKGVIICKTDL